jgi:hypothetical protein
MEYQVARMLYQFRKLPLIQRGEFPVLQGGNLEFELFGFFEACYHLKDWLAKETEYHSWSSAEDFIKNSQPLRICADICNTLKHRQLDRKPRSKAPLGLFSIRSMVSVGPGGASIQILSATIPTERGEACCFSLARECLIEWSKYFELNSIDLGLNDFLREELTFS